MFLKAGIAVINMDCIPQFECRDYVVEGVRRFHFSWFFAQERCDSWICYECEAGAAELVTDKLLSILSHTRHGWIDIEDLLKKANEELSHDG